MSTVKDRQEKYEFIKYVIDELIASIDHEARLRLYSDYLEEYMRVNEFNEEDYNYYMEISQEAETDRLKVENQITANLFNKLRNRESTFDQFIKTDLRCKIALMLMDSKYQRFFVDLTKTQIIGVLGLSGSKSLSSLQAKSISKIKTQLDRNITLEEFLRQHCDESKEFKDSLRDDRIF